MVEKEEAGGGISEEEAAQYDRQIRLWGLEAQKRSGLVRLVEGGGWVEDLQGASGLRRWRPSGNLTVYFEKRRRESCQAWVPS